MAVVCDDTIIFSSDNFVVSPTLFSAFYDIIYEDISTFSSFIYTYPISY
jgi:hypothetical protein